MAFLECFTELQIKIVVEHYGGGISKCPKKDAIEIRHVRESDPYWVILGSLTYGRVHAIRNFACVGDF